VETFAAPVDPRFIICFSMRLLFGVYVETERFRRRDRCEGRTI